MNILYVGNYNFQAQTAPTHRVTSNAKIFSQLGHTVIHLSQGESTYIDQDNCKHYVFLKAGKIRSLIQRQVSIREIIEIIESENIQVVIVYNYHAVAMYRLLRYCRKNNIKIIADVTEWYQFYTWKEKVTKGVDTFLRMRFVHPRLDGLIVISKYLENFYDRYNIPMAKIPPLIDYDNNKWQIASDPIAAKPSLIAIATADKHKDDLAAVIHLMGYVLEMQDAPDFYIDIVGMTKEQYVSLFSSEEIPEKLQEHICFHGRIKHEEVLSLEKKAWYNIFVREDSLPNNAGFPSKVAESLACGTPVITNCTSNIFEYVKNGSTGFMLYGTMEQQAKIIYDALNLSLQKVGEMHRSCKNERVFAQENYHAEMMKLLNGRK